MQNKLFNFCNLSPRVSFVQTYFNKKVLLRERKWHTARRVASARYAALSNGYHPPSRPGQGGTPGTPHHPDLARGYLGYPHNPDLAGGTPGYPHPDLGWGTPPSRPVIGHPPPIPGMGYPPRPEMGGTPPPRPEMGYPPHKMLTDRHL